MNIIAIAKMPTLYESVETGKTHESVLRSYNILLKTKELLEKGTPPSVVLELIYIMENLNSLIQPMTEENHDNTQHTPT